MSSLQIATIILAIICLITVFCSNRIYNKIVLFFATCAAGWAGYGGYTTAQIMGVVYPALASTSLVVFITMMYRYFFVFRGEGIFLSGLFFGIQFLAVGILALVSGESPLFDFDTLRPHLVSIRFLMVVSLMIIFGYQVGMILSSRGKNEQE